MPFRLTYRGPLAANGGPEQKQALRRHFHPQLLQLWKQPPLTDFADPNDADYLNSSKPGVCIYPIGGFSFATLVTERLSLHAELDILFLRQSPPGKLLGTGGDIDNRLKTLFDGLRRPISLAEIPKDDRPSTTEVPFHVLLSDDALISKINVSTDQFFEATSPSEVMVIISVTVARSVVTVGNLSYVY